MKKEGLTHPKMADLAARLGVELPYAIGTMELLWAFTGDHAAQGDVGKWGNTVISAAVLWKGEPDVLIAAMVSARLLDEDSIHRLLVHHWPAHCQSWVHAKLAKLKLSFYKPSGGRGKRVTEYSIEPSPEASVEAATLPSSPSKPSPSKPSSGVASATPCASSDAPQDDSAAIRIVFEHYRLYHPRAFPRPSSKTKEWPKIKARLADGYSVQDLCLAIDGCQRSAFHSGENDAGKVYQNLELIVRDGSKVNQFMELANGEGPVLSEKTRRNKRAADSYLQMRMGATDGEA